MMGYDGKEENMNTGLGNGDIDTENTRGADDNE
jgi:hypothetical protein